jgi:hypothetical protein
MLSSYKIHSNSKLTPPPMLIGVGSPRDRRAKLLIHLAVEGSFLGL